ITPTATGDTALTGLPQRPILVAGVEASLPGDQRVFATTGSAQSLAWFNMAAFAQNPAGLWGDTPRGYLVGPAFWNVDVSFARHVDVGAKRIELRVEVFNLFNHSNWANTVVQIGSTGLTNGPVTNTHGEPPLLE